MANDNNGNNVFTDMVSFNLRAARGVMEFWAGYVSAMMNFSGMGAFGGSATQTVRLQGKAKTPAEGTYRIENREFRRVKVTVHVPLELKDADGNTLMLSSATVDPEEVELGPRQSRTVQVKVKIDGKVNGNKQMPANVDFSGEIEAWSRTQCGTLVVRRVT